MDKIKIALSCLKPKDLNVTYHYALGDWCGQQRGLNILPNPLNDVNILKKHSDYIDALYFKIAPALAKYFNQNYKSNFSLRYWEIVTSSFVIHWLSSNYYKYLVLKNYCVKQSQITEYDPIEFTKDFNHIEGIEHYLNYIFQDHFIHFEFQEIIENIFPNNFKRSPHKIMSIKPSLNSQLKSKKEFIIELLSFGWFYSIVQVYGISTFEKILIHVKLFPSMITQTEWSRLFSIKSWKQILPQENLDRNKKLQDYGFIPHDEFEEFISNKIFSILPLEFTKKIPSQPFYFRVRSIFMNTTYHDQKLRFYIARIIENGGHWFCPQHGGGYGQMARCSPTNIEEYNICTQFLTWGWKNHGDYKIKSLPLPSPMLSKLPQYSFSVQSKILYVGTVTRKINFRFNSFYTINGQNEYRNTQFKFFNSIKKELLSNIVLKEHHVKVERNDELEYFLNLNQIEKTQTPASIAALSSKVVIIDHLGTTLLQTLVMNTPTIIFFDENSSDLTEEALRDFEPLLRVGIWHESETSAAHFLNENYNQIEKWWNQSETQSAIKHFCQKYALTSKTYLRDWINFIKESGA